jgi:hypothetical protein
MNPPVDWLMVAAIRAELPLPREELAGTHSRLVSAQGRELGVTSEMLVASAERVCRDRARVSQRNCPDAAR